MRREDRDGLGRPFRGHHSVRKTTPSSRARHRYDPATGLLHPTPNWNLVNAALAIFGPCSELALCSRLLVFQALCCGAAFYVRHLLAGVYKD